MHVVLYAEGPGETGAVEMPPLAARRFRIAEDALGPAHVLTQRCIATITQRDPRSIQFRAPLMSPRGTPAKGSQLFDARTLAKLLTWLHPDLAPDLAIVLVDADGSEGRRSELESAVERRAQTSMKVVVAVAVQEFEAWLLADLQPLRRITARSIDALPSMESRDPGYAKHTLDSLLGNSADDRQRARLDICRDCDLEVIARSSRSFRRYLDDLRHACATII